MTREEAIERLKWVDPHNLEEKDLEAIRIAIEALQTEPTKAVPPSLADVYKWERDIALSQLEEYGIGFAEKKRDDLVEVVRCKDCKASRVYGKTTQWLACEDVMEGQATDPDGYCYLGERREP